ncbi:arrestin domain-containing protein 5-like [Anticarsia gemmatalis]|uniref:arrestin domain-containing protein 5-like n=1 Tax=Anticarsia gemmatalis TaxID=129554 RepID=UPI003F7775BD
MGVKCEILLKKNDEGVYRSGTSVKGIIRFSINNPTTFGSVTVALRGKGKCAWVEADDDADPHHPREEYISSVINVYGRGETRLNPGEYEHPFKFHLPYDIPSTVKGKTGRVYYKIVAIFTRTGMLNKKDKFKLPIPVCGNLKPCSEQPCEFFLRKVPFSFSSNPNPSVNLSIEMEKTFLTAGEDITLNFKVLNKSSIVLKGIKVKLIQEDTSTENDGTDKQRVYRETVREIQGPKILGNIESGLTCVVPTTPNLNSIQHSNIFKREYIVNVTAVFPFPHRNVSVEKPVVIGECNHLFRDEIDK